MDYKEKAKDKIIQEMINGLDKEVIPWRRTWKGLYKHFNPTTENEYRGRNQLLLQLYAVSRGYNDPRWMTFEQAKKQDLRIKKGSTGLTLMKYTLYNPIKKVQIDKSEFHSLSTQEQENIRASISFFTVFNGDQIEGIEPYEDVSFKPDKRLISMSADAYLEKESIQLVNDHEAAYYPVLDNIAMPPMVHFDTEDDYYATLFHEIGHSTGHQSRLNRNMGSVTKEGRAFEELVAELTSVIVGTEFGLNYNKGVTENHKAYCQGWSKRLSEKKELFFEAINLANKASQYIMEKIDLKAIEKEFELSKEELVQQRIEEIRNEQYDPSKMTTQEFKNLKMELNALHAGYLDVDEYLGKKVSNSSVKNVELEELKNKIQITDYARSIGLNITKAGKVYSLVEYDSCKIYPDNHFYRFSTRSGGDIFEFIKMFEEVDMQEAINRAKSYYADQGLESADKIKYVQEERVLDIPTKMEHTAEVEKYLVSTRKIDTNIVKDYIDQGIIYQDDHANVIFVGKDAEGMDVAYSKRGTRGRFKGVTAGSNMKVGVVVDSKVDSKVLIVTEGVIDGMSYQMLKDQEREYNYLSTQSVNNASGAINYYLTERGREIEQIVIAFDNDDAGIEVTKELIKELNENFPELEVCYDFPEGKDWNEDLKNFNLDFSGFEKGVDLNVC